MRNNIGVNMEPRRDSWASEGSIYRYYIQYNRLNKIIKPAFAAMPQPTELIVYLNLTDMLKSYRADVRVSNDLSVASLIINAAGHYMNYFKRTINLPVKIHMVYGSYIPPYNRSLIPNYNMNKSASLLNDSYTTSVVNDNLEIIKTLVPYIPSLYFNTTMYEPGVLMYEIIKSNPTAAHIIIDKDQYNYQLASENTVILRPRKKSKEGQGVTDESYFINNMTAIYTYCKERSMKVNINDCGDLSAGLYSIFLTLNGTNLRDMGSKGKRATTTANKLRSAINDKRLINGHNTILECNIGDLGGIIEDYDYYSALDIPTQHLHYKNSHEYGNLNLLDLSDPQTLNHINNNYFAKCPIILGNF